MFVIYNHTATHFFTEAYLKITFLIDQFIVWCNGPVTTNWDTVEKIKGSALFIVKKQARMKKPGRHQRTSPKERRQGDKKSKRANEGS